MPGIFGFVMKLRYDCAYNKQLIRRMRDLLAYNPLFQAETFADNWFAIGNIGLPFNDSKPTVKSDNRHTVATSGYIYSFRNLKSDELDKTADQTDQLLRLAAIYKERIHTVINGSYNLVMCEHKTKELTLLKDRFGHRQLYYYEDNSIFLFSTEIKAFFAYERFDAAVDLTAVADFFNYSYPLGDKTFFRKVSYFPGGHVIKVTPQSLKLVTYWDFSFEHQTTQSVPELVEEMDQLYSEILPLRLKGGKEIAIPLSGGLDSRLLVSHAVRAGYRPILFSHGKRNCLDHKIARKVAVAYNLEDNFHFIDIEPLWIQQFAEKFVFYSEGMNNTGPAVLLGISTKYNLDPTTTIFLNGIYGGPTNFGPSYYKVLDITESLSYEERLQDLRRSLFGELIDDHYYNLFSKDSAAFFRKSYMSSLDEEFSRHAGISNLYCHQKDTFFIKNRLYRHMNLVDCNRHIWHDHFGLADDGLMDFYLKLPTELKTSRQLMIEYFKTKLPEMARIAYQSTGVNLYQNPSELKNKIYRKIQRMKYYAQRLSKGKLRLYDMRNYSHFSQWYRSDKRIYSYYEDILLDKKTIDRGYYNRENLEKLLIRQRNGGNSFFELSNFLAFELFNRLFIDDK